MYFKDYFKAFRTIQNTRGTGKNLLLPQVRTDIVRKSFYFNDQSFKKISKGIEGF